MGKNRKTYLVAPKCSKKKGGKQTEKRTHGSCSQIDERGWGEAKHIVVVSWRAKKCQMERPKLTRQTRKEFTDRHDRFFE